MVKNWPHSNRRGIYWDSHICDASVLGSITGNRNFVLHFHYFVIPRPTRKIILGTLLHGRVPRTVLSHHRLLGMPPPAGRRLRLPTGEKKKVQVDSPREWSGKV